MPRAPRSLSDADTDPIEPLSDERLRNRVFGRYELLMEMARGGMATLYLGRIRGPQRFEKLLAVKTIHPHLSQESRFIRMFLDEARIAALIQHPNVATVFDLGDVDGTYFIAMEYVHGESLAEVLRAALRVKRDFPWPFAVRFAADAAAGLHAAHELLTADGRPMNVVHRDVSPQNILVSYEGHVKLVDFGVAYAREKLVQTVSGTIKGKVGYMSPEQVNGLDLDRRSDVFSVGVILYEAVCRKRLFRRDNETATILAVREADVPPPRSAAPDIPAELERIILKALARDRCDRFENAQELTDALERLLVSQDEVVGYKRIARFMEQVFHDRKKAKDQQIQLALASDAPVPVKAIGVGATSDTGMQPPGSASPLPAPARKSPLWIAALAGAAASVAIALGVWFFFFRSGSPAPDRKPERAESKASANTHADPPAGQNTGTGRQDNVTFRVVVRPVVKGTVVVFRGEAYQGSEFSAVVPRSRKPEPLEVRAPGYLTQKIAVVPSRSDEMTVTLRKADAGPARAGRVRPGGRARGRRPRPRGEWRDLPR